MNSGWQIKKLGDVYQIGSSKRVLKSQWKTTGVPFYRGREVTRLAADGFVENELFISEEHFAELSKQYGVPKSGDIVITAIGTIGNAHIVKATDRFYFKDASILWMKRISEVSSEFINYWLKSPLFYDQLDKGNGATVDTLTIQKLQSVELLMPPLPEQQRIVAVLDEAFAGIAKATENAQKNLANARELFESHLQSIFTTKGDGWVEKKVGDLGQAQTGSTPKTSNKGNFGNHIPFIKPADFRKDGTIDYENDGLSLEGAGEARIVPAGSILMVCIGATIGKTGFAEKEITTNQQINSLTPKAGLEPKFLYYGMLTTKFQQDVIHSSAQATLPIINKSKWCELKLSFPKDISAQQRIVAQLDRLATETKRLEVIYQQKLDNLAALKQSILQKAFAGELNTDRLAA